MDYSNEQLEEKFKLLPEDLQKAMMSVDISKKIQAIGDENNLVFDQLAALADLTSMVMLGIIPAKDFVSELVENGEMDRIKATKIAEQVNAQVLNSVRSSLQKIQEEEDLAPKMMDNPTIPVSTKETVLHTIENPASHVTATPINLLAEEYPMIIPGKPAVPAPAQAVTVPIQKVPTAAPAASAPSSPLNLMDRFMSAPVSAKNETVEKKAEEIKPMAAASTVPKPPSAISGMEVPKTRIPGSPDPYREPIE